MDYKHQYESMKKMVTMYQDEIVPGLWQKIKELEKQMPTWIPVSERLPDKQHDWVLVACKLTPENWYGVPHIAELRKGVWWADYYDVPLRDAGVVVTH